MLKFFFFYGELHSMLAIFPTFMTEKYKVYLKSTIFHLQIMKNIKSTVDEVFTSQ